MKVVLCTIIVVITTNLIRMITLFPAARFNRFFFLALHGKTLVYKNLNFKQVSYESGTLHNYCSDNLELNSKDNSEYAVLCSLLRGSTDFFFWLSMGRRWAITTLNFKEVSYESGNLHNHSSDNLEPNSKDNSEYAVLCSLLRGSTVFFLAFHGKAFVYQNFEFKEVSYGSVILYNHCGDNLEPNSKDISEYAVLCPLL